MLEHFQFKEDGTTPYGHDLHTIRCYLTRETRICGLRVGISMVFEILGDFLFKGGRDYYALSWLTYHQMLLDTRNKNIYSLGVGISTVFEIFGHFLFKLGRNYTVWSWPTYHMMFLDTRTKNMYDSGVGISTIFEIFGHFLFKGVGTSSYSHDLHTIWCSLSQRTRIYMYIVCGWKKIIDFQDIKRLPFWALTHLTGTMILKLAFVLCQKAFM
jgi:hypothetical protein